MNEFNDKISALVQEKLAFIAENREKLVAAWIAETGLLPSESMLVQQDKGDGSTDIWVQPKSLSTLANAYEEVIRLCAEVRSLQEIQAQFIMAAGLVIDRLDRGDSDMLLRGAIDLNLRDALEVGR